MNLSLHVGIYQIIILPLIERFIHGVLYSEGRFHCIASNTKTLVCELTGLECLEWGTEMEHWSVKNN